MRHSLGNYCYYQWRIVERIFSGTAWVCGKQLGIRYVTRLTGQTYLRALMSVRGAVRSGCL